MSLQPLTLPNPAFFGLAKSRQRVALAPEWATKASNIVIDNSGRLAARKGWVKTNTGTLNSGATIKQIHEYINDAGTSEFIVSTPTKIYSGLSGTPTDKTGALVPTAGNWKFINFNNKCYGWQASHTPIVYTGAGNFAALSASTGTLPDGNTACAAFGRIWALDDDKQTIRYCALLDATKWATADGGGVIDMRSVWTKGMDEVMAIVSYGSNLIVFGKRHIVIWTDGAGSEIGLDPVNMYVASVIENVGTVARDSVCLVGEIDVIFWSSNGVRSLRRTLQEQATPVNEVSIENRDYVSDYLSTGSLTDVRSVYSPKDGFYLLIHPSITFCFDTRYPLPENQGYRMTTWTMLPTAACASINESIYFGFAGGLLGYYGTYQDNTSSYRFTYESGWILMPPADRLKVLKRWKVHVFYPAVATLVFKWWTDFGTNLKSEQVRIEGDGDEWNVDEWSLMEWSGGRYFHEIYVPMTYACQYVKIGLDIIINGAPFGIQSMSLYAKPTRLA